MAIMQSCCCWQSVRRGSYACAVYTGIYFAILAVTTGTVLQAESEYLSGNRSLPESSSFLEPGTISPVTVRFNITLLICSCFGVLCSLLLVYGLAKDKRVLLLPWIGTVITCCAIDVAHALYIIIMTPNFNPITAMLYTLNFFLLCLNWITRTRSKNGLEALYTSVYVLFEIASREPAISTVYSLLCVISQYQEYLAGRGTAADDNDYRVPAVRYTVQTTTTATSCLSSRRAATNNETKATATPTQSPTAAQNVPPCSSEKSPTVGRPHKKHVQFPDTPTSTSTSSPIPIAIPVEKLDISLTNSDAKWTQDAETVKMTASLEPPAL